VCAQRTIPTATTGCRDRDDAAAGRVGATSLAIGEWEVRDAARGETRFHFRTGITRVVLWLVVSDTSRLRAMCLVVASAANQARGAGQRPPKRSSAEFRARSLAGALFSRGGRLSRGRLD